MEVLPFLSSIFKMIFVCLLILIVWPLNPSVAAVSQSFILNVHVCACVEQHFPFHLQVVTFNGT
jgi:hypothetical protein